MNLLKTIIFIGLALLLAHCGGQGSNEKDIKVARMENGVPKTEDGRIILSSQSEGELVIPEGEAEGVAISRQKLAKQIEDQFDSISEVTRISFSDDFYAVEIFGVIDRFTVSFNMRTTSGDLYENVQCVARSKKLTLFLLDCENDQVVLSREIYVDMNSIALGIKYVD